MPTVVKANVALTFKQGDLKMTGTEILDQIMPGLIPAALVALVYWMLGKKVKSGMDYLNDHCCIYLMCSIWNFKIIKKKGR